MEIDREQYDETMQRQEQKFRRVGVPVRMSRGGIHVKGTTRSASGLSLLGVETILQTDNGRFTTDQLGDHEGLHQYLFRDKVEGGTLWKRVRAAYFAGVSKEERARLYKTYAQKYKAYYAKAKTETEKLALREQIVEEIICDAYAGMNRDGAHAEQYQHTVKPIVDEWCAKRDAMLADAEQRYSIDSFSESMGLTFEKDGQATVFRDKNGKSVTEMTPEMVRKSQLGAVLQESVNAELLTESEMEKQLQFFSDLVNMMLKVQDIDLIWAVSATVGFQPIESGPRDPATINGKSTFSGYTKNSDPQYSTTVDFTTICLKTQAVIDAMSATMVKLGRGLTEDEVVNIVYRNTHEAGEPVPCPVCYVFSRWVGLGGLFDNMLYLQRTYENADPELLKRDIAALEEKIDQIMVDRGYAVRRSRGNKTYVPVDSGKNKSAGEARTVLYKDLMARLNELQAKQNQDRISGTQTMTAQELRELEQLKEETRILDNWTWLNDVRLAKNYKAVPAEILLDINRGKDFAEQYPESWKFRTTRGPAMGKTATPYADEHLGQILRGAGIADLKGADLGDPGKNPFLKSKNGELTPAAQQALDKSRRKIKAQNLLNGQRYQSTSDFRFEYALDYLLSFVEMQALGGKVQLYTKVPESVRMFASVGAEVNCSLMPLGNGYTVGRDGRKTLTFSSVTGMNAEDAFRLSEEFDNVQPIMVGVNNEHIKLCLADERITFIIPYHASGASEGRYVALMKTVGEAVENRTDYSDYQTDHKMDSATAEQKAAYDLRMRILTGKVGGMLSEADKAILRGNAVLENLYKRFYGRDAEGNVSEIDGKYLAPESRDTRYADPECAGVFLTKEQAGTVMPFEYWDRTSTVANADENGKAFAAYCSSLGLHPRFSGWDAKGKYHAEMDFSKTPGYWKMLIDRSCYNRDGSYHEQRPINVTNFSADYLLREEAVKGITQPSLVNDPSKTEKIAEKSVRDIRYSIVYEGTADQKQQTLLTQAKQMKQAGHSEKAIRKATGWWINHNDGNWRFEVDDSRMRWKVSGDPTNGGAVIKLGDLIEHRKLFEAYPSLRNVDVKFTGKPHHGESGAFESNDADGLITLERHPDLSNRNVKEALAHEIQHAIQDYENRQGRNLQPGFSESFGYESAFNDAFRKIRRTGALQGLSYHEAVAEIEKTMAVQGRLANFPHNLRKKNTAAIGALAKKRYETALGELEAEKNAERVNHTAGARRKDPFPEKFAEAHTLDPDVVRERFKRNLAAIGWSGVDSDLPKAYIDTYKGILRAGGAPRGRNVRVERNEREQRAAGRTVGGAEQQVPAQQRGDYSGLKRAENELRETLGGVNSIQTTNHLLNQASEKSGASSLPEVRYSLPDRELSFADQVELLRRGQLNEALLPGTESPNGLQESAMYVAKEPTALMQELGYGNYPVVVTQQHVAQMLGKRDSKDGTVLNEHNHQLTEEQVARMPELLAKPAAVLKANKRPGSLIFVTTETDYAGRPVIIPVRANGTNLAYDGVTGPAHVVTSMYGRDAFKWFFEKAVENGDVVFYNKERIDPILTQAGFQSSGLLSGIDSETILGQVQPDVKSPGERRYSVEDDELISPMDDDFVLDDDILLEDLNFEEAEPAYAPAFYSKMEQELEAYKGKKMSASSAVAYLRGHGVKAEEIKWSGVETFLQGKKSVDVAELLDFVRANQLWIYTKEINGQVEFSDYEKEELSRLQEERERLWDDLTDAWRKLTGKSVPFDLIVAHNAYLGAQRLLSQQNYAGEQMEDYQRVMQLAKAVNVPSREIERIHMAAEHRTEDPHWSGYATEGGQNYRELLFMLPDSDYTNSAMDTHWGKPGVLAHARVQDFETPYGEQVLFVEEIQSDWHNAGQQMGYVPKNAEAEYDKLHDQAYELAVERRYLYTDLKRDLTEFNRQYGMDTPEEAADRHLDLSLTVHSEAQLIDAFNVTYGYPAELQERLNRYFELEQQESELIKQAKDIERGVPDAPYAKTYHEFVLKNLLREAAEKGYSYVAWTTGKMQEERWSSAYAEGYRIEYDQEIPKFLNKYGRQWGAKVKGIRIVTNPEAEAFDTETEETLQQLRRSAERWRAELELAEDEGERQFCTLQLNTIESKIENQLRRSGGTLEVPAIPITPEMRESVLYEGQPRYSVTEEGDMDQRITKIENAIEALDDRLMFAEFDMSEGAERKLRNQRAKLMHELQTLYDVERRERVQTPLQTILDNLDRYSARELEHIANELTQYSWDEVRDTPTEELKVGIRQVIESKAKDLSALEMQAPRFGVTATRLTHTGPQRRYSVTEEGEDWFRQGFGAPSEMRQNQATLDALNKRYGTISAGEKPFRSVEVPQQTTDDDRVSQTARTVMEAEATPEKRLGDIKKALVDGKFSHIPVKNTVRVNAMRNKIKADGYETSLRDWRQDVDAGKVNANMVAEGAVLYNNAANSDMSGAEFVELVTDYAALLTRAGQALQAARILKRLSPEAKLYGIQREVRKMNDAYRKRAEKKRGFDPEKWAEQNEIKIDPALIEAYRKAKTDEERDEIMDQITTDVARQMPASLAEKLNNWRYLAMLGNFKTQIRNVVGNAAFQIPRLVKEEIAGGIEDVAAAMGLNFDRTRSAKRDLKTYKAAWADAVNVRDIILNGSKLDEKTSYLNAINEKRRIYKNFLLEGYRRATNTAMDEGDFLFCRITYADALASFMAANGTTWDKAPEALRERGRRHAIKEAAEATYRDRNAFSNAIAKIGFKHPESGIEKGVNAVLEGVLPFKRTPANILARGVEYSPLGVVKSAVDAVRATRSDEITGTDVVNELAKGLTGSALLSLGFFLAKEGLLTGTGPDDDEKEKAFWELQGNQSYSLAIDGKSYTIDWLAPESIPLLTGANLAALTAEEGWDLEAVTGALTRITDPMLEMSMLQGVNDMLENIANTKSVAALPTLVLNSLWSYGLQYIPTFMGQIERAFADGNTRYSTYKEANSGVPGGVQYALGKLSQRVPGWDYNQIPYIDQWGRTEQNYETSFRNTWSQFLNPSYESMLSTSEMETELQRLYEVTGDNAVLPSDATKYFTVDKARYDMTGAEYVQYAMESGSVAHDMLTALTESREYQKLDDEQKVKAIKKVYDYAKQTAKETITGVAPDKWITKVAESRNPTEQLIKQVIKKAEE